MLVVRRNLPVAVLVPVDQREFENWIYESVATDRVSPTARVRPVVTPKKTGFRKTVKRGSVVLPQHLEWSHQGVFYDMSDARQRAILYEVVIREGRADDVRLYVNFDDLAKLWSGMFLPSHIRAVWEAALPELVNRA